MVVDLCWSIDDATLQSFRWYVFFFQEKNAQYNIHVNAQFYFDGVYTQVPEWNIPRNSAYQYESKLEKFKL